jgi:hypothetical protein
MKAYPTMSSQLAWIRLARSSVSGASDSLSLDCLALRRSLEAGVRPAFPPSLVVPVKALACELPGKLGLPLSRLSIEEIRQHVISQGLVAQISGATLWRWLSSDALRPWQHRSWIFPRDPNFADKAGSILDLYERVWEGAPLGADDYVISADEKTSIQARRRKRPTLPPASNRPTRVEHEYFREGFWTYLAAWDVHRAQVFGRCEAKSGIAPVDRLISEVMSQEPYKSARPVFWIMDNCSAHRGEKVVKRLRDKWPNPILIHTPVHASWLNQVENLFLDCPEKSPHAQRFLISGSPRTASSCLPVPL